MPVYMIQAGQNGPVKIGYAEDVAKRLHNLQLGNHEKLKVLRLFKGGAAEETRLHERFADNHLRGEWHHFCQAMMGDVELIEIAADKPAAVYPQPAMIRTPQQGLLLEKMRENTRLWQNVRFGKT